MLSLIGCGAVPEPVSHDPYCAKACVGDPFADYFADNGGVPVFGEPFTPVLEIDNAAGSETLVQYFDSVRLEYTAVDDQISIADIGRWAFETAPNRDAFIESGPHDVDPDFKTFYDLAGGEAVYGKPLTPKFEEGGDTVQYFENARLTWQPGAVGSLQGVHAGFLGRIHYEQDQASLLAQSNIRAQPIDVSYDSLVIEFSAKKPIIQFEENAVLQAAVFTPTLEPLADVRLELQVWQEGQSEPVLLEEVFTNDQGRAEIFLDLPFLEPNQSIAVEMTAYYRTDQPLGNDTIVLKSWW